METHGTRRGSARISMLAALVLTAAIATPVALQSCQATHNADGTITIRLTPEVSITAHGLEDALEQLINLLSDCQSGYTNCSPELVHATSDAIRGVIEAKDSITKRAGSSPTPGQSKP